MDEQAGPGVFFNNNNNSALAGGVKAVQPGDGGGEAARAQYSIPGILHFLQHEWARFEVERAQWDVERAELQHLPLRLALARGMTAKRSTPSHNTELYICQLDAWCFTVRHQAWMMKRHE
ncbi:striatin-like [Tachysurus ichikawai]